MLLSASPLLESDILYLKYLSSRFYPLSVRKLFLFKIFLIFTHSLLSVNVHTGKTADLCPLAVAV